MALTCLLEKELRPQTSARLQELTSHSHPDVASLAESLLDTLKPQEEQR